MPIEEFFEDACVAPTVTSGIINAPISQLNAMDTAITNHTLICHLILEQGSTREAAGEQQGNSRGAAGEQQGSSRGAAASGMSTKSQYDAVWWAVLLGICGEQKNMPVTKTKPS